MGTFFSWQLNSPHQYIIRGIFSCSCSALKSTSVNNSYSNKQSSLWTFLFPSLTQILCVLIIWWHLWKSTGVTRLNSIMTVVVFLFLGVLFNLLTGSHVGPMHMHTDNYWTCRHGLIKVQHLLIAMQNSATQIFRITSALPDVCMTSSADKDAWLSSGTDDITLICMYCSRGWYNQLRSSNSW